MRFEGTLYAGTTNGLLRFNESARHFENVDGIPQNQTFNLLKDNSNLYVANDGLFSIRNNKTSVIRTSISGDLQLSGLLIPTNNPNMLLGGATFGVSVFSRTNKTKEWKYAGIMPGLNDQFWTFGRK